MSMEVERTKEYASKGVAGAGLGLGIAGTALGVLSGGLGNLGGWGANNARAAAMDAAIPSMVGLAAGLASKGSCSCNEDHTVNRYEAAQQARIAELETEVKLRDANTYTDQKMLEMYKYIDGQLKSVNGEICRQAVLNQQTADSFKLVEKDIQRERDERCCGDNSIVTYANATFYPKQVADVTTGTTTTAQSLYNPLPNCGGCCRN